MFRDMDVKFESKIQKYVTYVQERLSVQGVIQ
jgi:hypothetical protein